MTQAGLRLLMYLMMILNPRSFCLYLPGATITDVYHHAHPGAGITDGHHHAHPGAGIIDGHHYAHPALVLIHFDPKLFYIEVSDAFLGHQKLFVAGSRSPCNSAFCDLMYQDRDSLLVSKESSDLSESSSPTAACETKLWLPCMVFCLWKVLLGV